MNQNGRPSLSNLPQQHRRKTRCREGIEQELNGVQPATRPMAFLESREAAPLADLQWLLAGLLRPGRRPLEQLQPRQQALPRLHLPAKLLLGGRQQAVPAGPLAQERDRATRSLQTNEVRRLLGPTSSAAKRRGLALCGLLCSFA